MDRNDLKIGDTLRAMDTKDLHTYIETLEAEGYLIKVDGLKITVVGKEQSNG